ncbi:MAG: glycosyltransferase family 2 protein [Bacteroidota bacterium]
MKKLTAIIPCKNEEQNIEEVLKSVEWADEIMIVDSYSTDRTIEIAKKFTGFILVHEYINSAAQKNWAIPQANNEWILLIDADERVTPGLKKEIQTILNQDTGKVAFWICRENYFLGKKLKYGGTKRDKVIRLFKRDLCRYEEKQVHSEIIANGEVGYLKNKLVHNTCSDLSQYLEKVQRYALWSAKDHAPKTGTITAYHVVIKPLFKFFSYYFVKLGFLDGFAGFISSAISSYSVLLRYLKLWELRKK